MTVTLGILNSFKSSFRNYADACRDLGVAYEEIDVLSPDWLKHIQQSTCDGFLAWPSGEYQERNAIYMEKLYFINQLLKRPIYPSYRELLIYENKRTCAAWLDWQGFPHPNTRVFVRKEEAEKYIQAAPLPFVIKSNIGSAAMGVDIIRDRSKARKILHRIFGRRKARNAPGYFKPGRKDNGRPISTRGKKQRHFVIIQDYHDIRWEWRMIRIGDSYFGHQKLLKGSYASGSGEVGWVAPPEALLNMTREVCDRGPFCSMAMDVFETTDGQYLINELQTLFGSIDDSQMYINDKPGRFRYRNGQFEFEEGYFNQFASCRLRVEHFLKILQNGTAS